MRIVVIVPLLALMSCSSSPEVNVYQSALTGQTCRPDPHTLMPKPRPNRSVQPGNGGHNSPTGIPGDNLDDPHSRKIDCYYDGNSGQGDDRKHPCTPADFPQPGCDQAGCCDVDVLLTDPEQMVDTPLLPQGDTPPPPEFDDDPAPDSH